MIKHYHLLLLILLSLTTKLVKAQCPTSLVTGQNLVTNGDFSQGYTGWTHDPAYVEFTSGNSNPGSIYAGVSEDFFNTAGFNDYPDHTPNADGMSLMVDGTCNLGQPLWVQANIPVVANTTYYFGLWISSLKNNFTDPGRLRFDVNGVNLPFAVTAPGAGQTWVQFETTWFSGVTSGNITISIENTTVTGCATEVDFAIDDISFIPGCAFASIGPQPNLGPDKTICGTGGSILLDANVPHNATTTITWSDGTTGTGLGAPYTKTINAAGTYSVCATDAGSCVKSDVIVISNTYSINLGPNLNLCNPPSVTLDAVYTGIGVTYQWYKPYPTQAGGADNAKTYFVNTPGTYRVDVTDPSCGLRSDVITITTTAATAVNATYCTTGSTRTVSVTGGGTYKWYSASSGGTFLVNGLSYTTPSLTAPTNYTYYVEDISSVSGSVGPTAILGGVTDWGINANGLQQKIHITQDLTITSLKVPLKNVNTSTGTITVEIRDNSGNPLVPARQFTSNPTSITNAQEGQLVQFNFTGFDLQSAWGLDLRMDIIAKTINASPTWNQGCGCSGAYPYTTPTGILTITGAGGANATNNDFVDFYDIQFQTGTPCARVPVQVIYDCPLPVEMSYFSAKASGNTVLLNWSTLSEINNNKFILQRSTDGINFVDIASQKGAGNSTAINNYSFIDYPGAYSDLYYRIKQLDMDEKSSFSTIEKVSSQRAGFIIYPSPSQIGESLTLVLPETTQKLTISIMDIVGQVVYNNSLAIKEGVATISIGSLALAKGIYFVEIVTNDSATYSEKMIIE